MLRLLTGVPDQGPELPDVEVAAGEEDPAQLTLGQTPHVGGSLVLEPD